MRSGKPRKISTGAFLLPMGDYPPKNPLLRLDWYLGGPFIHLSRKGSPEATFSSFTTFWGCPRPSGPGGRAPCFG